MEKHPIPTSLADRLRAIPLNESQDFPGKPNSIRVAAIRLKRAEGLAFVTRKLPFAEVVRVWRTL